MNKKKTFCLLATIIALFVVLMSCESGKQTANKNTNNEFIRGDYRIMFYNCENLFDIFNDSLKRDDEFTPEGAKHWTWGKYLKKVSNISKVITAVGGWEPPEIVGVCEIENRYVLESITQFSPLKKHNYQIVHRESPDRRGIDVGLLYIQEKFNPIDYEAIRVNFPAELGKKTRDILYVKGETNRNDTLHIFVNHWPSRWGGQMETDDKRMYVASIVRHKADSIFEINAKSNIIIMGDLNDFPEDRSLMESLKCKTEFDSSFVDNELYNLAYYLQEEKGKYSHRYQGEGGILDQIIISGALLNSSNSINTTKDNMYVYDADFLLEEDETFVGLKPFRTYIGYKFHDGYSDHLPVYIDLFYNKK